MVKRGGKPTTKGRFILAQQRRAIALEMRIRGAMLREISEHLGMTQQGCSKTLRAALDELVKSNLEKSDQLRQLTCTRFDRLIDSLWDKALDGDIAAVREIRKLEESRHRIIGTMVDPKFSFESNTNINNIEVIVSTAREKLARLASEAPQGAVIDAKLVKGGINEQGD